VLELGGVDGARVAGEPRLDERRQLLAGARRLARPVEQSRAQSLDLGRRRRGRAAPVVGAGGRDDRGVRRVLACRDEMQGAAQQRPDDELAALERGEQLLRLEALDPRGERDRQRRPVLRLQRADALDRVRERRLEPVEQPLPRQQRSVERARVQGRPSPRAGW
jgi:hypothetical protein